MNCDKCKSSSLKPGREDLNLEGQAQPVEVQASVCPATEAARRERDVSHGVAYVVKVLG